MTDARSDQLYRLLYVSTAEHFLSHRELEALVQGARARNAAAGITGMLIYTEGHFLQYIEGPQSEVEALFTRIERDPRHHGMLRIFEGPQARRIFTEWSMGYCTLRKDDYATVRGALDLAAQPFGDVLPDDTPADLAVFMESYYRNSLGLRSHDDMSFA